MTSLKTPPYRPGANERAGEPVAASRPLPTMYIHATSILGRESVRVQDCEFREFSLNQLIPPYICFLKLRLPEPPTEPP